MTVYIVRVKKLVELVLVPSAVATKFLGIYLIKYLMKYNALI